MQTLSLHVRDITVSFASELRHSFSRVVQDVDFDVIGEKGHKTMLSFPVVINLGNARRIVSLMPPENQR